MKTIDAALDAYHAERESFQTFERPEVCACSTKDHPCRNRVPRFHVLCEEHRVATGGYPFARSQSV